MYKEESAKIIFSLLSLIQIELNSDGLISLYCETIDVQNGAFHNVSKSSLNSQKKYSMKNIQHYFNLFCVLY